MLRERENESVRAREKEGKFFMERRSFKVYRTIWNVKLLHFSPFTWPRHVTNFFPRRHCFLLKGQRQLFLTICHPPTRNPLTFRLSLSILSPETVFNEQDTNFSLSFHFLAVAARTRFTLQVSRSWCGCLMVGEIVDTECTFQLSLLRSGGWRRYNLRL